MNFYRYLLLLLILLLTKSQKVNQENEIIILKDDNFVTIRGEINSKSASQTINKLMEIKSDKIYLYLITPGGSVSDGMQIIQTIKALEKSGKEIICIANIALSMGFVILQYCPTRIILQSSIVMQHQTSLELSGPLNNVNSYMSFIHSMGDEIDKVQSERIGISITEFQNKISHDWWLFGNNILKNNIADKMAWVICKFEKENTLEETEVNTLFGKVKLYYSKCPVATDPLNITFPENIPNEEKNKYSTNSYILDMFK